MHLSDGSVIPCGMVVWSTGVAPRYTHCPTHKHTINCTFQRICEGFSFTPKHYSMQRACAHTLIFCSPARAGSSRGECHYRRTARDRSWWITTSECWGTPQAECLLSETALRLMATLYHALVSLTHTCALLIVYRGEE